MAGTKNEKYDKEKLLDELTYRFLLVADFYIGPTSKFKSAKEFCDYVQYTSQNFTALKRRERHVPIEVAIITCRKLGVNYAYMFGDGTQMFGEQEAMQRIERLEVRMKAVESILKTKNRP